MHTRVHCLTVYSTQHIEAPKCPWTKGWVKKLSCIYTMEYYLTIKKDEIMLFVAPRMSLKIVILSEVSQTEKNKYHMTPLYSES